MFRFNQIHLNLMYKPRKKTQSDKSQKGSYLGVITFIKRSTNNKTKELCRSLNNFMCIYTVKQMNPTKGRIAKNEQL